MSRADHFIKFPLAAALLAAMGTSTSAAEPVGESVALIAREQVPGPALNQISRLAGGLDFGPVTVSEGDHRRIFAADMTIDGHAAGVQVDEHGHVVSVTTQVEPWELPALVKRTAEVETLGFPARTFTLRQADGVRTYLVDAATPRRGKRLEISEFGEVINKELKLT